MPISGSTLTVCFDDADGVDAWLATFAQIAAYIGAGSAPPAGQVSPYAGSSAPAGWLLCDGAAVSRTTYAALFAIIGTLYGAGDGSTTFNVPNLKGRSVFGYDAAQVEFDTLGETGGAKTVTLAATEIPAHSHAVTDPGHTHTQNAHNHIQDAHNHAVTDAGHTHVERIVNSGTAGTVGVQGASTAANANASNAPSASATTGLTVNNATPTNQAATATNQAAPTGVTTQNAGGGGAHQNLAPYIVLQAIIKT